MENSRRDPSALLKAMGIDCYAQRKPCWVFVDDIQDNSEEQVLLTKMLAVLELSKRDIVINPKETSGLPKVILAMGKKHILGGIHTINSHHPRDILADASLKRTVYEDLLAIKKVMHE